MDIRFYYIFFIVLNILEKDARYLEVLIRHIMFNIDHSRI